MTTLTIPAHLAALIATLGIDPSDSAKVQAIIDAMPKPKGPGIKKGPKPADKLNGSVACQKVGHLATILACDSPETPAADAAALMVGEVAKTGRNYAQDADAVTVIMAKAEAALSTGEVARQRETKKGNKVPTAALRNLVLARALLAKNLDG